MKRVLSLACAAISIAALCACSGGSKKKVTPTSTSSTASTSVASTTPTSTPASSTTTTAPTSTTAAPTALTINPFTGGKPVTGPVIAVKIDDTGPGHPQRNIDQADVVYVEEVEGGYDRLLAIFDTHKPVVGYVRSIRLADPELLAQYGKITLAASGGSTPSLKNLKRSGLPSWLDGPGRAYFVRMPHANDHGYINLTLNLAKVSAAIKTAPARNVGFVWNAKPAGLAALPKALDVKTEVGRQPLEFKWNAKLARYVRWFRGADDRTNAGKIITTSNVIVQTCTITNSTHKDVNHNPQQLTQTVGHGAVRVFRNGHEYVGTWTRANANSPTIFKDAKGAQITLAPGGAWVALIRPKTVVQAN